MMRLFLIILGLLFAGMLHAQDSVMLSNKTTFAYGLYHSWEAFIQNKPDQKGSDLERVQLHLNPQTQLLRMARGDSTSQRAKVIIYDAKPYLRIYPADAHDMPTFALLRVRGRIGVFSYQALVDKDIPITAYNPLTGRPFRRGYVERKVWEERLGLISWSSGQVYAFNKENVLRLTAADEYLQASIEEITISNQEQLLKSILIFDDRNPLFLYR